MQRETKVNLAFEPFQNIILITPTYKKLTMSTHCPKIYLLLMNRFTALKHQDHFCSRFRHCILFSDDCNYVSINEISMQSFIGKLKILKNLLFERKKVF